MMLCWDSLCSLLYLIAVMKKQKIGPGINNVVFIAAVYALIKAPGFVSDPQQNQEPGWCRRIQMSDEVMSLSRCCGSAVLSLFSFLIIFYFLISPPRFFCAINGFIFTPSLCVLILTYAPLSLRPLTCEVKSGHRWGPREQGCIQFQRLNKWIICRNNSLSRNLSSL